MTAQQTHRENNRETGAGAAVEEQLLALVRDLGREMHWRESNLRRLSLKTTLEDDLGLDSLTRLELLTRLERGFSVRLPADELVQIDTLGDLRDLILRAGGESEATPAKESGGLALDEAESTPAHRETLVEVLEWHVRTHPDRPHIQLYDELGQGEVLSFRELYRGAARVAAGLQTRGLESGDTVALMLPTGKDYFFSFFGVLLAGGVPVSLYPPTRPSQLEEHLRRHQGILENCAATRLIAFPEVLTFSRLLKANAPSLDDVSTVEDIGKGIEQQPQPPRLRGSDLAFLQYTSGSTGNPKGVELTHTNLIANIRALGDRMEVGSQDVIVSWLPLYHDMGLIGCWLGSLWYSCLFVVMSPMDFVAHPERWLWAIHRYRGTISAAPNFAYELCLNRIAEKDKEGLDLRSWRVACNGAEAVSPETVRRFTGEFRRYGLRENAMMPVYGLAENSVGLTFPPLGRIPVIDRVQREPFSKTGRAEPASPDDGNPLGFAACGYPLAGHEIRVVDDIHSELPDRQEGSLQFRGPSATRGYHRNPAETRKLFNGQWLNTGDRAYTADGDVYITGRDKDVIIHGGRNLYPQELEEAVGNVEGIRKGCVAVFGSVDRNAATEQLVVVAETRSTDAQRKEALRKAVNLKAVDIVGAPADRVVLAPPHTVLKTSSGKIRRSATRDNYECDRLGPEERSPAVQAVRLMFSGLAPQLKRWGRTGRRAAYVLWFWSVVALLTPLVWISVVAAPRETWRWSIMRAWGRVATILLGIEVDLNGRDKLPPVERPCVFVANHSSYLDAFVLLTVMPRRLHFVSKSELRERWYFRLPLDRIGVEYVNRRDRRQGARDAENLVERARRGKPLFYFPEGTLSRVKGVYPFHMGAFLNAVEAQTALVPIAIRGSHDRLRPGAGLPRPGRIAVTVAEPLVPPPADEGGEATWQAALALRNRAREAILTASGAPDLAHERPPIW